MASAPLPRALTFAVVLVGLAVARLSAAAPTLPDLVVTGLTLSHSKVAPDSQVGVTLTVANRGRAAAPPFRIAIYQSDARVMPARGNVTRVGVAYAALGLAAGKSATYTAAARILPCDDCKPGNLYAYADAWGTVPESAEDNNFRSSPIEVDSTYRPNLRVEGVAVTPDRGASGRVIEVSAVVRNTAPTLAYGPFQLGVYCADVTEPRRPVRMLASWRQDALAGGSSLNVLRKISVDPTCPVRGQQAAFGIIVDPGDAVSELHEHDNADAVPYWVLAAPDLTPGQIAVSQREGPPGARVFVSYRVENRGKSPAAPFKVGVYLSRDAEIGEKDTLADVFEVEGLGAETNTGTINQEVRIPKLPSGVFWLGVLVDTEHRNGELRKWNNLRATPFEVRRVNLTDKYFIVDRAAAAPGDALEISFGMRNTGADTAGPFDVSFYYSHDPRWDPDDRKLASVSYVKLGKGTEPGEHKLCVRIPEDGEAGYRYLIMVSDHGDRVAETDEFDNIALRPIHLERR